MKVDPARSPGYKIGYDNAGDLIPSPQRRQWLTYPTHLPVLEYLYLPNVEKVSLGLPDRVPQTHQPAGPGDTTPPYPKSVLWSVLLLYVHATCTCASSCICLPPESWSTNLVISWLINQLAQGKDSTVKSIRVRTNTLTQLDTDDLSDIRRFATIILLTTSYY